MVFSSSAEEECNGKTQASCLAPCIWDREDRKCTTCPFRSTETDCVKHTLCIWKPTTTTCKTRPVCKTFTRETECNVIGAPCQWDTATSKCVQVKPAITSCHDIKKINAFTEPSKICKIINCLKQGNQRSKECEDEITFEEIEIIDNIIDETIITKIIREIITSCHDITKLNDITDPFKICKITDCFKQKRKGKECEDNVDLVDEEEVININEITNRTIIRKILDDITKDPGKSIREVLRKEGPLGKPSKRRSKFIRR